MAPRRPPYPGQGGGHIVTTDKTTLVDGAYVAELSGMLRAELAAQTKRADRLEAALMNLADRAREVDEDLRRPVGERCWKTGLAVAGALRGAWIEAAKALDGETP